MPVIVKRLSQDEAFALIKIGLYRKPLELSRACHNSTVDCEQLARLFNDVLAQQGVFIVREKVDDPSVTHQVSSA